MPVDIDVSEHTALVTGATSGIGRATAIALAAAGARVVIGGRDSARGRAVVEEISDAGGRAQLVLGNLDRTPDDVRQFAAEAADAFGPIDILVNNAAVCPVARTDQLADADLARALAVNVIAPHTLVGQFAPGMAERGWGRVINIGSWMGRLGTSNTVFYGATKAAIEQMTRGWAMEWGPRGIVVSTVAPGITRTPVNESVGELLDQMTATTPAGRPMAVDQVADAVVWLASERGSGAHAARLDIDGGIAATRP